MADEETQRPLPGVPILGEASAPAAERGVERTEGGRGAPVDESPEARMMRQGSVTTSNPAPLPPDMEQQDRFEEIDNAAADEARMDVRRREHSAD